MYVCLCHGITDKMIKQTVLEDGVGNMRELKSKLGVGSQCGKCVQLAQTIIDTTIFDESLFKEVC
ncbi:(2Fe-2S)-binding protein [Paraglaciecola aquimarina]|uniref:Bacterioferritin-associated ferredoxin n=1 Tax=Paraglaciecola aquimarina TaxID=1235557 RepID=A0ABU3SWX8_9ALTE|nr:(2Fe-2S)-binding protein [Paraglaciecola aquimarina]MDU0354516.1 (2Fe-2S)-binding protein [Paraglaciecola aquimarina]